MKRSDQVARLFLLFEVQRAAAQSWAVLHQLQLFATGLASQRVVVVTGFLANQEYGFGFLLALGHFKSSTERMRFTKSGRHYVTQAVTHKIQGRELCRRHTHLGKPNWTASSAIPAKQLPAI